VLVRDCPACPDVRFVQLTVARWLRLRVHRAPAGGPLRVTLTAGTRVDGAPFTAHRPAGFMTLRPGHVGIVARALEQLAAQLSGSA
jgi:hypothetical protein